MKKHGMKAKFKSVLGFRHQHGIKFRGSEKCLINDFYIVCRLICK